jgi:hypothetical protein
MQAVWCVVIPRGKGFFKKGENSSRNRVGEATKVYVPGGISVPQPRTKQFFYPDAVIILLHNKVLIFFAQVLQGKKSGGVRFKNDAR